MREKVFNNRITIILLTILVIICSYQTWLIRKASLGRNARQEFLSRSSQSDTVEALRYDDFGTTENFQKFIAENPFLEFVWAQSVLNKDKTTLMLNAYQIFLMEQIYRILSANKHFGSRDWLKTDFSTGKNNPSSGTNS